MNNFDLAILLLRLSFGLSMLAHGANKVRGGLDGTGRWFSGIGMRHGRVQASVASISEMGGGVLLTAGLLTAPACTVIISLMLVAIVTVHWKVGYFIFLPNGGWEYCASIAAVCTAVSMTGPGRWSLDHLWDSPVSSGLWSLPLAVGFSCAHLALFWRPPASTPRS